MLTRRAMMGRQVTLSGFALEFYGYGQNTYVDFVDAPHLRPTVLSMAAWVKITDPQKNQAVFTKRYAKIDPPYNSYGIDVGGGKYRAFVGDTTLTQHKVGSITDASTDWTYVTSTFDGSVLTISVNGVLENTVAVNVPIIYSALPMRLGNVVDVLVDGIWALDGQLDDVRLYDRVLTQEEQLTLAQNRSSPIIQDGLVLWSLFDEGAANTPATGTILDSSPYAHNGTAFNNPYFRAP